MILKLCDLILSACGVKTKTVSATAEFGETPGSRYRAELAHYSDHDLIYRNRDDLLAEIRAGRRQKAGMHR
jgi:hypothetical protein